MFHMIDLCTLATLIKRKIPRFRGIFDQKRLILSGSVWIRTSDHAKLSRSPTARSASKPDSPGPEPVQASLWAEVRLVTLVTWPSGREIR